MNSPSMSPKVIRIGLTAVMRLEAINLGGTAVVYGGDAGCLIVLPGPCSNTISETEINAVLSGETQLSDLVHKAKQLVQNVSKGAE